LSEFKSSVFKLLRIEEAARKVDRLRPPHSLLGFPVFFCALEELRTALAETPKVVNVEQLNLPYREVITSS